LTEQGIASAWLNQPCEVAELRERLARELALSGDHPPLAGARAARCLMPNASR